MLHAKAEEEKEYQKVFCMIELFIYWKETLNLDIEIYFSY